MLASRAEKERRIGTESTYHDEAAELLVARDRRRLAGDALHEASVTSKDVREVLDDREPVLVVGGAEVRLGDSESYCVRETLAERAGGHFDAVGVVVLGVAGRLGVDLTEVLQVLQGELVPEQVQEDVLQRASGDRYISGIESYEGV